MRKEEANKLTVQKREEIFETSKKTIEDMIKKCINDGRFERELFCYNKELDGRLEEYFKELGYDIYTKNNKRYISWL